MKARHCWRVQGVYDKYVRCTSLWLFLPRRVTFPIRLSVGGAKWQIPVGDILRLRYSIKIRKSFPALGGVFDGLKPSERH